MLFMKNYHRDSTGSPVSRGFTGRPATPLLRPHKNFLLYDNQPASQTPRRACRDYPVLWRKRSLGTKSDKGDQWVERILFLRQTCRGRGRQTFPALVEAMTCYFKGQPPDIAWIAPA
jgi:transposase